MELIQIRKKTQNCRLKEISAALLSGNKIKINSQVSEDSKAFQQIRTRRKIKSISWSCAVLLRWVLPSVQQAVHIHIFFFIILCAKDALLALLTQHESVRVTQRSSGVPICCRGTWAQMRHQQLPHRVFLHLRPLQRHLKHGLCLTSLLKQVGFDRLLPHPREVSFITVIYQKHCCASALLFMCLQREVSNHPKERPTSNDLS